MSADLNNTILSLYNGSVLSISILIFLLGIVAVKSSRSALARLTIITFTVLSYVALFIGPVQLLSYAKPTSMEWINRDVPEAEVLHAELREGDGIYLLLDWYGVPRYYKIPWDPIVAQQLIEAMEQAREQAGDGERPGARPPMEGEEGQEQEQGTLDQLLGPVNAGDGSGQAGTLSRGTDGNESGEGQGQRQGNQRGDTTNSGNGKVMMRFPFDGEGEFNGEADEGGGPSGEYNDTPSQAMFYPAPQPRYPEKVPPK